MLTLTWLVAYGRCCDAGRRGEGVLFANVHPRVLTRDPTDLPGLIDVAVASDIHEGRLFY